MSNSQGNNLSNVDGNTIKKRELSYVEQVNKLVCKNILGSPGTKAQWAVPFEKEKVRKHSILAP